MLFRPNWKKMGESRALKRIERIDDPALLLEAFFHSEYDSVKIAAIERIDDPKTLLQIAENSAKVAIRLRCLTRIPENTEAQMRMAETLIGLDRVDFPMPEIIKRAIGLLTSKNRGRVAVHARHYCIYTEAVETVTDQSVLDTYVHKYPDAVPITILGWLDRESLQYIAQNEAVQSTLREMACAKLGHSPDGKNKCTCSVCGRSADASRDPAFSLHHFEQNVCKRCGAVLREETKEILGRDGRRAAHVDQIVVRYPDGAERVMCGTLTWSGRSNIT